MTGTLWLKESGQLGTPIAITNTHQVGIVRDALVDYEARHHPDASWLLPVVAETYDGWLNDINGFHLAHDHVFAALDSAASGPVAEGNVGGGTGMICHDFKGGIGTSSRVATVGAETYTVGVLVQANYGDRRDLRVDGAPIGREISEAEVPLPWLPEPGSGSIIIVVATDAPLLPYQCERLAQRATVGLGRVGGIGHNGSGDIFLAFATGNHIPYNAEIPTDLCYLPNRMMNPLFYATVEAVEEAILNALTAADTLTGFRGRTAHALPLERLQALLAGRHILG
jgi:D-aminopeptidase